MREISVLKRRADYLPIVCYSRPKPLEFLKKDMTLRRSKGLLYSPLLYPMRKDYSQLEVCFHEYGYELGLAVIAKHLAEGWCIIRAGTVGGYSLMHLPQNLILATCVITCFVEKVQETLPMLGPSSLAQQSEFQFLASLHELFRCNTSSKLSLNLIQAQPIILGLTPMSESDREGIFFTRNGERHLAVGIRLQFCKFKLPLLSFPIAVALNDFKLKKTGWQECVLQWFSGGDVSSTCFGIVE